MSSAVQSGNAQNCIVGIDPGTRKCGIAVVGLNGHVFFRKTVCIANLITILEYTVNTYQISAFALGNGTGSEALSETVSDVAKRFGVNFGIVQEKDTTQEGYRLALASVSTFSRILLLFRMITGFESPDEWAAVVIAKRAVVNFPK
jgi:RNase H-fold protein (predicted Holliday junction resolvase)